MKKENNTVKAMWESYVKSLGKTPAKKEAAYESWHFCNNEKDANELAELVLQGTKRATASLYDIYAFENEQIPKAGDHSVITTWDGTAKCIIKTTAVNIVPFKDVTAEFAATEGEGDKSLEYWKRVHRTFFSQECAEMSKTFNEDMLVVCEEFEVVYR